MKPTTPESRSTAYARLQAQGEAEAERQRGRPRQAYLAELDRLYQADVERQAHSAGAPPPVPVSLLTTLDVELTALAAAEKFRAKIEAKLAQYPEPAEHTRKILADQVRGFRGTAQGALATLDNNPGQIENWKQKIADVPPDCGSPTALAVAHFEEIRPLLDRARSLAGTVEALDRMVPALDTLVAELLARGAPVGISTSTGPLVTEATAATKSKVTELHHV